MPPPVQRHIRRVPLGDRLRAYLHPSDVFSWLSEEAACHDWDEFSQSWSTTISIICNISLIFARSRSARASSGDEIFQDYHQSMSGYFASACSFIAYCLALVSLINALITMTHYRSYRLFHVDPQGPAPSPAARKVRVDSPLTTSPLAALIVYFLPSLPQRFAGSSSDDEVWELSIWDPPALCLRTFALFSPANVIIIWLFLPASTLLEQRASVVVAQTIGLCTLISIQGSCLQSYFSRQGKHISSIYKQVAREYDVKYVQPKVEKRLVRDVGIQLPHEAVLDASSGRWIAVPEVVSSSAYSSPRGFRTFAHPVLTSNNHSRLQTAPKEPYQLPATHSVVTPIFCSNSASQPSTNRFSTATDLFSSPITNPNPSNRLVGQAKQLQYSSKGTGDGGSLGIHSHDRSPLRKTASGNSLRRMSTIDSLKRESSPWKRV